jgi:hypothetical protein
MINRLTPALLAAALLTPLASAAERLVVTVTHTLDAARPSETITVPWAEVNAALPHALLQKLSVKDAAGHSLAYQVTNVAPLAKDPEKRGAAYGELIFQYDFAAGEKSATFTVEKTAEVVPAFPVKAFARYVPERLDDFAWENDRIAHRIYGQALAAPSEPAGVKEVLITSGIDVWCKRVRYPIVDRWYNKGHDHYHTDEGEGMDTYSVGTARGCGGTGIWDSSRLHVGRNYKTWRVIANGPVRAVFELTFDTWAAGGVFVSETKRYTVDAGHNLDRIESTFTTSGKSPELTVAIGIVKDPTDKKKNPQIDFTPVAAAGSLTQWTAESVNGDLGVAVIVPGPEFAGYAEDDQNQLVLAKVTAGKPVTFYAGAGWSRSGDFPTRQSWLDYVAACAARARSPITVTTEAAK